ncbi:MAG: glycine--tRNA ligase subunit beta [Leptospirales bacterium]
MANSDSYLFELYTEEIPAFYQIQAVEDWEEKVAGLADEYLLTYKKIQVGATPRRIFVLIDSLEEKQSTKKNKLKGPPKAICFKDGSASPALKGFSQKAGVEVDAVGFEEQGGKEYATVEIEEGGEPVENILPGIFEKLIQEQKFPKTMRWGNLELRYARPILSYYSQYGNKKTNFSGGIWDIIPASDSLTGLFYTENNSLPLTNAGDYINTMKDAGVLVDPTVREEQIVKLLKKNAGSKTPIISSSLLKEVNFLVENPHVIQCKFEEEILELPDILILSEMEEHQRYFALRESNGSLSNEFLVVVNGERQKDADKNIGLGNERVLRARLSDGAYFFHEDRKTSLGDRVKDLDGIVFQQKMGTMTDKKERLKAIASTFIAFSGFGKNLKENIITRAGDLAKVDLTTLLVYEFDHLQGEIGAIYARLDGEDELVVNAIREHYLPKNQDDDYPESELGIVFSIAEKIDNLVSGFICGKAPKATQDPLGLRRQTLYLIEIFIQNKIHLSFRSWLQELLKIYDTGKEEFAAPVWDFVCGRIATIFEKEGFDKKLIQAGIQTESDDLYDIYMKMSALRHLKEDENFNLLMVAFRRMNNIVNDYFTKNKDASEAQKGEMDEIRSGNINSALFKTEEEKKLYECSEELSRKLAANLDGGEKTTEQYEAIFQYLAAMKGDVDIFFDKVMVMDEDTTVRNNRLSLLHKMVSNVKKLMDVSRLQ